MVPALNVQTKFFLIFRSNQCSNECCNHKRPIAKVGIICGNIFALWNDLKTMLQTQPRICRNLSPYNQAIGVFIPTAVMESTKLRLMSMTRKM